MRPRVLVRTVLTVAALHGFFGPAGFGVSPATGSSKDDFCFGLVVDESCYEKFSDIFSFAKLGKVEAEALLGHVFLGSRVEGYTGGKNYPEAYKWLSAAAKSGSSTAQYDLGVMYWDEEGVTRDWKEAVRWFRLSATQGEVEAQYILGLAYETGKGVDKYYVKSHVWCNIASSSRSVWSVYIGRDSGQNDYAAS